MEEGVESTERGHGDSSIWDSRWKNLESGNRTLFTTGIPQTVEQLENRGYFEGIWDALGRDPSKRCVELGAGRGNQALYLASKGVEVTMLDLSGEGFRVAKENFDRHGLPHPEMVVGDVRETGLESEAYDMVLSIGLLEHFEDPVPILRESLRLLKPGGRVHHVVIPLQRFRNRWLAMLLLNPAAFAVGRLKSVAKWILRYHPVKEGSLITPYFIAEYTRWLEELGCDEVAVTPICPYHAVHRSDWAERNIAMPVYRLHHRFKNWMGSDPATRTTRVTARALLVQAVRPSRPRRDTDRDDVEQIKAR